MEVSFEGLDVVQETLTDDMNEGDSPFDTTTGGKYIIDEVSYYNSSYSTCVHVYILCVISNNFFSYFNRWQIELR